MKFEIREAFLHYWEELDAKSNWLDLGMGMPDPKEFFSGMDPNYGFMEDLLCRADYQPQAGSMTLRSEIASFESQRSGSEFSHRNIMLVSGALRGFSLTLDHLLKNITSIVEITPTYPLLAGYVRDFAERTGCMIHSIATSEDLHFQFRTEDILPWIRPSSLLYLTNPNNPTGQYIPATILNELITACEAVGAYVIIDECSDVPIHSHNATFPNLASSALIRIRSFSKNYLLAGFRLGYIIASDDIIQKLSSVFAFSDGNASLMANTALLSYLRNPSVLRTVEKISKYKVDKTICELSKIPNIINIIRPNACYYIFVKTDYRNGSWDLFTHLLESGINIVPGNLFGIPDQSSWIRICCARSEEELDLGLTMLKSAFSSLPGEI